MDVDKMFNLPKLGSTKNKRKFSENPTPEMMAKFSKPAQVHDMPPPPMPSSAKGKQRATIEDVTSDNEEQHMSTARHDLDDTEDEDDPRFFGGGLTAEQQTILQLMDTDTNVDVDGSGGADGAFGQLTLPAVRKMILALEKAINTNREMRVKYANDPSRFVESEIALDSAIHSLLLFTQDAGTFYPEFVRLEAVRSMVELLAHENADIALAVVEVFEELTDEDVDEGEEDDYDAPESSSQAQKNPRDGIRILIEGCLENVLLPNLYEHLVRLSENEEAERNGVFHILGLLENFISAHPPVAQHIVRQTKFVPWILERIQKKAEKGSDDLGAQNRQYAAEILAIILQCADLGEEDTTYVRKEFGNLGGLDTLLIVLSAYRKKDPKDADEIEFVENLFDSLCSALALGSNKALFVDNEGVELMIIMMKEKKMAAMRAVKVLDHALSTEYGAPACLRFITTSGLKTFFPIYMRGGISDESDNNNKKKKQRSDTNESEYEEHILGILVSLFSNLDSESNERMRVLAKFVETDYGKVDRLLEMRESVESRVQKREKELEAEVKILESEGIDMDDDEKYLRRLEVGLFSLQLIDYIIGWLCMEDDGIYEHTKMLLKRTGSSFDNVMNVLEEYKDNIGDSGDAGNSSGAQQREIVGHLIEYLRGV